VNCNSIIEYEDDIDQGNSLEVGGIIDIDLSPVDADSQFCDLSFDEQDAEFCPCNGSQSLDIDDAYIVSFNETGRLSLSTIAAYCDRPIDEVVRILFRKGVIMQNPETWGEDPLGGWEEAEEYLSGDIFTKYEEAKRASERYRGRFDGNVEALKAKMKQVPAIDPDNFHVPLGSRLASARIYDAFFAHLLGMSTAFLPNWVHYDEKRHLWRVSDTKGYSDTVAARHTYGTPDRDMFHLAITAMNLRDAEVYDHDKISGKSVFNAGKTALANERIQTIVKAWEQFIQTDESARRSVEKQIRQKFGYITHRRYDGSFLDFPGLRDDFSLFPYQRNAIMGILKCQSRLLAHDVGTGKSAIMICAGMKLRQTG